MWSHYGSKHQGVCFGTDFTTESMYEYGAILLSLGYINSVNPLMNLFIRENTTDIMLWSFLKFDKWKYENEVRIYKNQYKGTLTINLNNIKEIYLGCNIEKKHEDLILSILDRKSLNPKVFKNRVSKNSFELESIEM